LPLHRRLRFEPLEDRRLLATVDTLIDVIDAGDGVTSLREAVANATPGETIDFAVTGTIPLSALGNLQINKSLLIDGPGSELLTIVAFPTHRIFVVDDSDNLDQSDVSIRGLTLTGGFAGSGGAIFSREQLEVVDSVITGNTAEWGGGIYNDTIGKLTVVDSQISGNDAFTSGGGIYNWGGTAFVFDSLISGNDSDFDGGGIQNANNGSTTISRSTISGNTAQRTGGGIFNADGKVLVAESTLSGNTADFGGGIYVLTPTDDTTTISNSTISGNTAPLGGAGIFTFSGQTVIQFSTVTENNSNDFAGSGVVTWGDPSFALTAIRSTIIAGNHHTDVAVTGGFVDTFDSLGYNVIGVGSIDAFDDPGDMVIGSNDPGLAPLADNGGPTLTHALLAGSPAIDAGDPDFDPANPDGNPMTDDAVPYDQRGGPFVRVFDGAGMDGARIDIGAYELILDDVVHALFGDYNRDDTVNAADYTTWRNASGQTGVELFTGADGNGDGMITRADFDVWKAHYGETVPAAGAAVGQVATDGSLWRAVPDGQLAIRQAEPDLRAAAIEVSPVNVGNLRNSDGDAGTDVSLLRDSEPASRYSRAYQVGARGDLLSSRQTLTPALSHGEREQDARETALLRWLDAQPMDVRQSANRVAEFAPQDGSGHTHPTGEFAPVDAAFDLLALAI
jgi:hypothetical protein